MGWKELLNENITVFYYDGTSVSKKSGRLIDFSDKELFILIGTTTVIIPREKLIRGETPYTDNQKKLV